MIFYSYDIDDYVDERGFWVNYKENMPGPVVLTTDEIVTCIVNDDFDLLKVKKFADEWNTYSTGQSTESLINAIYNK